MDNLTFKYIRYLDLASLGIGAGAGLVGSLLGQSSQERMIDKMNEYNDPKNQIRRLRGAGINPAFMLNQGTESLSGNQSSPAQGVEFDLATPALQAQSIQSQIDLNKATEDKLRSETELNESDLKFRDELNAGQLRFLDANTKEKLKGVELSDAQIKNLSVEYGKLLAQVDEINAHTSEIQANANKMNEEAALAKLRQVIELRLAESHIAVDKATINELASAAYANAKRGDLDSLAGDYQKIVNKYVDKTESIKQQNLQSQKQKTDAETSRIKSATTAQDIENERQSASQWLETFKPFAGMRSYFGAIGNVFGGSASVLLK